MGAVDPSQVSGDIKKNLWLTLEDLLQGGLKHVVAHVMLSQRPQTICIPHAH